MILKPLHYHTLVDLALDLLKCFTNEGDGMYSFDVEQAEEATKFHLPEPMTKDEIIRATIALQASQGAGTPESSCIPFKLAFILHHALVEDCDAELQ